MQAPTHFLVGMLIYKAWLLVVPDAHSWLFWLPVLIFSFLSHYIVDALAYITYHVPDARPNDKFWLSYHIFIYTFSLVLLILYWEPYWLALFGSILIDIIDWGLLRGILKKKPFFHPGIDKFRAKIFPFLPNLLEKKWTIINEFIIWALIFVGIFYL